MPVQFRYAGGHIQSPMNFWTCVIVRCTKDRLYLTCGQIISCSPISYLCYITCLPLLLLIIKGKSDWLMIAFAKLLSSVLHIQPSWLQFLVNFPDNDVYHDHYILGRSSLYVSMYRSIMTKTSSNQKFVFYIQSSLILKKIIGLQSQSRWWVS